MRLLFHFAFFEQEKSNIPSFIFPNGGMQCFGHIPPFSSEAGLEQVAVVSQAVLLLDITKEVSPLNKCFKGQMLGESKHHSEQIHPGRCIPALP